LKRKNWEDLDDDSDDFQSDEQLPKEKSVKEKASIE